jgi:arylsulfatase A-like enzyme
MLNSAPRWRLGLALSVSISLSFLLLSDCHQEISRPRPDLLLVTFDTLRADHCSTHGYERETTPTLQRLAEEGVLFTAAYAPTATTAPSHASLLTGLAPLEHGVHRNGLTLPETAVTLAERLGESGYDSAAFVSSVVLKREFGFAQGFGRYDDDFSNPTQNKPKRREWQGVEVPGGIFRRSAAETTDRALAWLEAQRDRVPGELEAPLLLWVHYYDPHEPYTPPSDFGDPFRAAEFADGSLEQVVARYDTLVRYADHQLGRLIAAFSITSNPHGTLTFVTADHGEAFLEHGWRSHGVQIFEESIRVPWQIHWPGEIEIRRIEAPVSLFDALPTLLGLLEIPIDDKGERSGRNLGPALRSGAPLDAERKIPFQRQSYEQDGLVEAIPLRDLDGKTFGQGVEVAGDMWGLRAGRWKYIEAPAEPSARQLFDLSEDPGERRSLTTERPEISASLSLALANWRASLLPPLKSEAPPLDDQQRAALEALGYTSPRRRSSPEARKHARP